MTVEEFQKLYPTKEEKEAALKQMSDSEIDNLIESSTNTYGKIFYKQFKNQ